jgi:hypothetical protein
MASRQQILLEWTKNKDGNWWRMHREYRQHTRNRGGLEYFHRNSCESSVREPSSLRWDSNVWLWLLCYSDHWQIALQISDPSSRQKWRPKTKRKAIVWQKRAEKEKCGIGPKRGGGTDIKTDRPTDRRSQYQLSSYMENFRQKPWREGTTKT